MALYGGFDLHSSNNYLAIIDENDKRILKKKLDNDFKTHLANPSAVKKY